MDSSTLYLIAADAVLLLHILFVAFVVFGLLLYPAGGALVHGDGLRNGRPLRVILQLGFDWLDEAIALILFPLQLAAKGCGRASIRCGWGD